jgi:DNA-binding transcriptional MerR regulator
MPRERQEILYTLSDAARELGLASSTLRNYANAGLVEHLRTSNGQRVFTQAVIAAEKARRQARAEAEARRAR